METMETQQLESPPTPPSPPDPQTPEEVLERCKADFEYFCENFVRLECKKTHRPLLFELYPCQRETARRLVKGEWLWILKARQLGFTWLLAAYVIWLVTFYDYRTIGVMQQDKTHAKQFLKRLRFILANLPPEMHQPLGENNKERIEFLGTHSSVEVFAAGGNAPRSLTFDLLIFDEAAFIEARFVELLKETRVAAEPAVEQSNGQIVALSTSRGPRGDFYATFENSRAPTTTTGSSESKFSAVFYPWSAHPGRTQKWYDAEALKHAADPLYMKREYPASPEEAFESAEGRVYQSFTRNDDFIRVIELPARDQAHWKTYRGIDWGGTDPFVCLWGVVVPGDGPGLTIDPGCKNTIRELLGYSWEDGKPQEHDNHACDALRYIVTSCGNDGVKGHLHIYREIYLPYSAQAKMGIDDLANKVLSMSSELVDETVADRSRNDSITTFENMGIKPIGGQRKLSGAGSGSATTEIEQGIVQVNALVVGWAKRKKVAIPPQSYPKWTPGSSLNVQKRKPIW